MAGPRALVSSASERGRLWIENQDPVSRTGAGVGWFRRYQAADGQLYALLLTAFAVINVFFFGLGFGRALQLVHARSWGLDLRKRALVLAAALSPTLAQRRDLRAAQLTATLERSTG